MKAKIPLTNTTVAVVWSFVAVFYAIIFTTSKYLFWQKLGETSILFAFIIILLPYFVVLFFIVRFVREGVEITRRIRADLGEAAEYASGDTITSRMYFIIPALQGKYAIPEENVLTYYQTHIQDIKTQAAGFMHFAILLTVSGVAISLRVNSVSGTLFAILIAVIALGMWGWAFDYRSIEALRTRRFTGFLRKNPKLFAVGFLSLVCAMVLLAVVGY